MPYEWSSPEDPGKGAERLHLWPHRSLSPRGFAGFILMTFAFLMLPPLALLGTPLLWGILPFLLAALTLLWAALRRSAADGALTEELTLWPERVELVRHNPRGPAQRWDANPFWVQIDLHREGGPVENYVTLRGSDRTVEIGAFLSPDERERLYDDLREAFARARGA